MPLDELELKSFFCNFFSISRKRDTNYSYYREQLNIALAKLPLLSPETRADIFNQAFSQHSYELIIEGVVNLNVEQLSDFINQGLRDLESYGNLHFNYFNNIDTYASKANFLISLMDSLKHLYPEYKFQLKPYIQSQSRFGGIPFYRPSTHSANLELIWRMAIHFLHGHCEMPNLLTASWNEIERFFKRIYIENKVFFEFLLALFKMFMLYKNIIESSGEILNNPLYEFPIIYLVKLQECTQAIIFSDAELFAAKRYYEIVAQEEPSLLQHTAALLLKKEITTFFAGYRVNRPNEGLKCSNPSVSIPLLTIAYSNKEFELSKMLLNYYAEDYALAADKNGNTFLHFLCLRADINNAFSVASRLPDSYLNENLLIKNHDEKTVLYLACQQMQRDFIYFLMNFLNDVFSRQVENKKSGFMKFISTYGFHLQQDQSGKMILHFISHISGAGDFVFRLIEGLSSWQVSLQDSDGQTALHLACLYGCKNLALALIKQSDVSHLMLKSSYGETALSIAYENKQCSVVIALLNRLPIMQLEIQDAHKSTAFHIVNNAQMQNGEKSELILGLLKKYSPECLLLEDKDHKPAYAVLLENPTLSPKIMYRLLKKLSLIKEEGAITGSSSDALSYQIAQCFNVNLTWVRGRAPAAVEDDSKEALLLLMSILDTESVVEFLDLMTTCLPFPLWSAMNKCKTLLSSSYIDELNTKLRLQLCLLFFNFHNGVVLLPENDEIFLPIELQIVHVSSYMILADFFSLKVIPPIISGAIEYWIILQEAVAALTLLEKAMPPPAAALAVVQELEEVLKDFITLLEGSTRFFIATLKEEVASGMKVEGKENSSIYAFRKTLLFGKEDQEQGMPSYLKRISDPVQIGKVSQAMSNFFNKIEHVSLPSVRSVQRH